MFQTRLNKREGNAGIANLGPAKAHPLPQHAGDFGYIRIGIGVRRTAPNHHKAGFGQINLAHFGIRSGHSLADTFIRRL